MRLKSAEGGLLQQRDEWFPPQGTRHRQAWVVRLLVRKTPLGWDNGRLSIFYFLPDEYIMVSPWETTGTRKVWWLKRSSFQPHAPMTFSRKLSRTELLKQCGDGRREVSHCIQSTCQPFSKRFLLYKHQPSSEPQWPVMVFLLCLSSTFPFLFSIIFTQTCDMGDFKVHKAELRKPQSAGNPCRHKCIFPLLAKWVENRELRSFWWQRSCRCLGEDGRTHKPCSGSFLRSQPRRKLPHTTAEAKSTSRFTCLHGSVC